MYKKGGIGEKIELFNFGKSGAKVEFVLETFPFLLDQYDRKDKTIILLSIGGNNAKAKGDPTNFVSTPEEYVAQMRQLLTELRLRTPYVIVVGGGSYNESKTNPKISPMDGTKSFFTNARRKLFNDRLHSLCTEMNVPFVGVTIPDDVWQKTCLYDDGLHPNDLGYQYIFQNILKELEKIGV
jgi:lysophospholipase L1-like esterase